MICTAWHHLRWGVRENNCCDLSNIHHSMSRCLTSKEQNKALWLGDLARAARVQTALVAVTRRTYAVMLSVFVCLSSLRHVSPPESVSLHVVLTITSNDNSVTLPGSSTDWISSSLAKLSLTRSEWVRTCVRVYAHICLLPSITMLPWQPRLCVLCPLSLYRAAAGWNHLSDQGCPQAPPKHTESLNWKFTISSSLSPFNAGKLRVWSSSTPSFLWHLWTCHSRDSLVCLFCILAAVSSSGEAGTSLGPCAPLIPEKKEARWQREPRAINREEKIARSGHWQIGGWHMSVIKNVPVRRSDIWMQQTEVCLHRAISSVWRSRLCVDII